MVSALRNMKAFLYFGGAFVILLGGAVILMAPYHYVGFIATPPDAQHFDIWEASGYYPQLEIAASVKPANVSVVTIDFRVVNNASLVVVVVNMTLTEENSIAGKNPRVFEKRDVVDLAPGGYTVYIDRMTGASYFDLGLFQSSDSRIYIITGGALNIIGLAMCIGGYFVPGTVLPTGDETIVAWGYDKERDA
jgi:hypothetical protein